jgi:hypothetical protein
LLLAAAGGPTRAAGAEITGVLLLSRNAKNVTDNDLLSGKDNVIEDDNDDDDDVVMMNAAAAASSITHHQLSIHQQQLRFVDLSSKSPPLPTNI